MSAATKIYSLIALVVLAGAAIASQFINVREAGFESLSHTTNAGELVQGVLVGQTFVPANDKLSGISIMFATYSGRDNTQPIEFHLRKSVTDTEDLRSASVSPDKLADNQFYTFTFDPIEGTKNQTYFFFVTSPGSERGDASTVDLDTRDPYHLGTAYIARIPDGQSLNTDLLAKSGKQTVDVVFKTHHTVPLRQAIVNSSRESIHAFIGTWAERRGDYYLWAKLISGVIIFIALLIFVTRKSVDEIKLSNKTILLIFGALIVIAVLFRLMFAINMPLTSDEGNYLYDARTLLQGRLAGGDGYVKAPIFIAWVAVWQMILGQTIFAGRMSSVVAGVLLMIPIYFIGREMLNKYSGLIAAAAWAIFGGTVVSNIYVHTQPVALFLGIAGVAMAWSAVRGHIGKHSEDKKDGEAASLWWFFWSGALLGLGVASRKSVLALGIIPLMVVLAENKSWSARIKQLLAIGAGFVLVVFTILVVAQKVYGPQGVWEITGFNSAGDAANAEASQAEQVREYSIKGMTPFFRESLPMIILAVLGWGVMLEDIVWAITRRIFSSRPSRWLAWIFRYLIPKLAWILPMLAFMWARGFMFEYEGALFLDMGGMKMLWNVFVAIFLITVLWPRPRTDNFDLGEDKGLVKHSSQPTVKSAMPPNIVGRDGSKVSRMSWSLADGNLSQRICSMLVPYIWLAGLTFFYINWIKFHANYIIEFLPPLAIASGVGAYLTYRRFSEHEIFIGKPIRWLVRGLFIAVLFWAIYLSSYIAYKFEHTGTFNLGSTKEAADWARENIPLDQPIFTGAAVVPYLSGHHVSLDISHPRWYAYQFTRDNPERMKAFLPTPDEMVDAYRNARWFLMDSQTSFSFLMEYSEIEAGLARDWVPVKGIENGSNTLTFYQRTN